MAKYHLKPNGDPGICRAQKHCPFGDIETAHYSTPEDARAAYEIAMATEVRVTFNGASPAMTMVELEQMDEIQQALVMGGIGRLVSTNTDVKRYWQAVYDSTPHGALWLERKRTESRHGPHPEYVERKLYLDRLLAEGAGHELSLPEDPGRVFATQFSSREPLAFPAKDSHESTKVKLALLSAAWLSSLDPEEAEAISWTTSNGAAVLNTHISGREHAMWGHDVYSKAHLDNSLKAFRSAMAKAPELEEPAILYRGTSLDRVEEEWLDRPASATVDGGRARSFRGNNDDGTGNESPPVLLEIKTTKVASVCSMGVHGVAELEVLAPLGRYRKVDEFETLRGTLNPRFGGRPAIDPELDKIRVIQLEYLGY